MKAAGYPGLVVVGLLAGYLLFGGNNSIEYPTIVVPAARILDREPDTVRTFVDRVRYVRVEPSVVARGSDGAASAVQAFCRPVVALRTDTLIQVDTLLVLRSVTHSPGWFTQRDRLALTGMTNAGDLTAHDYAVRPGFSAIAHGDSLVVRYPRTSLLRELVEFAVPLAIGYGIAR